LRPQGDKKGALRCAQGDREGKGSGCSLFVFLSEAKDLRGSVSDRRTSGGPSLPLRAIALRATAQGDMKDRPQGEPLEFISETNKDTKSGDVCSDGSFSS